MTKLATIALVLFVASTADAKPKPKPKGKASVQSHMERAAKAHKEGKFEVALEELQAAYKIDPQPKLVYAIAQGYAKLDKCTEAIEHYEELIAKTKEKDKHAVAREAIDACKQKPEANPKAEQPEETESSVFRDRKPPESELPTSEANVEASAQTTVETKPIEPAPEKEPPPPPVRSEPPSATMTTTATVTTTYSPWY